MYALGLKANGRLYLSEEANIRPAKECESAWMTSAGVRRPSSERREGEASARERKVSSVDRSLRATEHNLPLLAASGE